jgi:hypothetical protein
MAKAADCQAGDLPWGQTLALLNDGSAPSGPFSPATGQIAEWSRQLRRSDSGAFVECNVSNYASAAAAQAAYTEVTSEIENNDFLTTLLASPMSKLAGPGIGDASAAYEGQSASGSNRHSIIVVFRKGAGLGIVRFREGSTTLQAQDALVVARAMGGRLGTTASTTGAPPASGIETPQPGSDVAIALNAQPEAAVPVAVFDASGNTGGITVPPGRWYLVTFDPAVGVRRSPDALASDGKAALRYDAATEQIPGPMDAQHQAFESLLNYLVTYQSAYLLSLDTFTGGFKTELFDPLLTLDADHAVALNRASDDLDAASSGALDAIGVLGARPAVAVRGAGPSFGLYEYLKAKIQDPIKAQASAKRARLDLALAFGRMTIPQQQEAFRLIQQERGLALTAADSASFVEKLDQGDFDNEAAQIRLHLQNNVDFFGFFDLRNIETAHAESAALVTDGAQFYGTAIKEVLDKTFPGIGKGWDLVEKLEKDLQAANKFVARANIIADYLRKHGQQISDAQASALANTIDATTRQLAGETDPASAFDTARIDVPIGRIEGADGERKTVVIALPYQNPKGDVLSLRCKYVGPASADSSTQSANDAGGIATFTFDAGYAPKAGTYALDCALDDYVTRSATFDYRATTTPTPEPAAAKSTPTVDPTLSAFLEYCQNPPTPGAPDAGSSSDSGAYLDFSGVFDAIGPAICAELQAKATALAEGTPFTTPTPEQAPPDTSSAPTCVPQSDGSFDPVGGLAGGTPC